MKNFQEIEEAVINRTKYILFDIDDTVTTDGKLTKEAYMAMWDLHDAGFDLIPVTGRPAGWCDLIIRQWPVSAVIGENGAFTYYFHNAHLKELTHPSVATGNIQGRLEGIKEVCLKKVPGARVSKDQFARIYDLAIDFNEDPPYLGLEAAEKIKGICESMGAIAKISSIHVNTWFGNYSKLEMAKLLLKEIYHLKVLFDQNSENKNILIYMMMILLAGTLAVFGFNVIFDGVDLLMFLVTGIFVFTLAKFAFKEWKKYKL